MARSIVLVGVRLEGGRAAAITGGDGSHADHTRGTISRVHITGRGANCRAGGDNRVTSLPPSMADTSAAQTEAAAAEHTADLERWIGAGLGEHAYIGTREGLEKLPDTAKAVIRAQHPHHWERLMGDESKLSADLALRLRRGELRLNDQEQLDDAGFVAASRWLQAQQREQMQKAFDESTGRQQEELAAAQAQREQGYQQARQEQAIKDEAIRKATYRRHLQRTGLVAQ